MNMKNLISKFLFLISLFILLPFMAFAHPNIEPVFTFNTETGITELSADEVFKLSLLFSECPLESDLAKKCLKEFEKIKKEVTDSAFMNQSDEEKGKSVLKLLYRDYLKSYSANQTKTDVALETGFYNCVSSALLYMAAAKACNLNVKGQKATEHALCSIYVPGAKQGQLKKIDVETTNPYGFNPGSMEAIENSEEIKKYYIVPKKLYGNRQEVSDFIFAGLIAGNICTECIKSGDYNRAIPLGAARYEVIRQESSRAAKEVRKDFDVLASNYVNLCSESINKYADVLNWYTSFIDRWGMTDFLQKNMDTSLNNLMVLCGRENNYEFAEQYFNQFKGYVTEKQFKKSEEMKTNIFFNSKTKGLSYETQITILNELINSEDNQSAVFQKTGNTFLENAWIFLLNDFMNRGDYLTGLKKSEEAKLQLPKSQKIQNMRQMFYRNCIAIIHNNFVKEANKGQYEKALQIISEGLELFPDDKSLKKDLTDLMKVM